MTDSNVGRRRHGMVVSLSNQCNTVSPMIGSIGRLIKIIDRLFAMNAKSSIDNNFLMHIECGVIIKTMYM